LGSSAPSADALLTWAAAMCVLVFTMWYVARAGVALVLSLLMVPYSLVKLPLEEPLRQVMLRKSYVLAGALLTFMASILAYFAPILNKDVGWGMQPVLRNNFWLTVHVLSITAAYAPGALAWMLGNLSLGYYLFGDYRNVSKPDGSTVRRGPQVCSTLAGYVYKSMQVSVLLLVAGTLLGGLWADVSWGRFWSWDPKEVWSLIAILAFMVVLHGRYARWVGDFGFAAGAVLGLTAIAWAWYGVSYLMPDIGGRHSYGGGGDGGQFWVIIVMITNWWLVLAAGIRYMVETWHPVSADVSKT
jgi:ABC-type transport system involved in cytochrome c biogenesis permease subunit